MFLTCSIHYCYERRKVEMQLVSSNVKFIFYFNEMAIICSHLSFTSFRSIILSFFATCLHVSCQVLFVTVWRITSRAFEFILVQCIWLTCFCVSGQPWLSCESFVAAKTKVGFIFVVVHALRNGFILVAVKRPMSFFCVDVESLCIFGLVVAQFTNVWICLYVCWTLGWRWNSWRCWW